ncbi:MAG: transcriptional repressor [Anaerolineae bacterium]|nr:transcriptional repressor [Anaerolineae bacterium]
MTHEDRDYIQALRSKGYRVTPQRLIVLDAICELKGHATIADIQGRVNLLDSTIDRSTVYRALDVLTEVGLVTASEMDGDTGRVYQIAGEARHHHLLCQSCGAVLNISDELLSPVFQRIQATTGFTVWADHLTLKGVCERCAQKPTDAPGDK